MLFGFSVAWCLAASPVKMSVLVKATQEGVVRFPLLFDIMATFPFLYTPTREYVVPKSIPIQGVAMAEAICKEKASHDEHRLVFKKNTQE